MVRKRARDSTSEAGAATASINGKHPKRGFSQTRALTSYERKRRAMEEEEIDSDIDSDDANLENAVFADRYQDANSANTVNTSYEGSAAGGSDAEEDKDLPGESVEEKRLRLAKSYLRKVGLDPDAAAWSSEEEERGNDSDPDDTVPGAYGSSVGKLQEAARRDAGRLTRYVAKHIGERYPLETSCLPVARAVRAHDVAPTCVSIGCDDLRAASGGKDSSVVIWDVETATKTVSFRSNFHQSSFRRNATAAPGHVGPVYAVAIADSQGGNMIASGGEDGLIRIWDVRTGKQADVLRGHRGAITSLAFRSGSAQLFSGSKDRTVKIWDVNEMTYVETLFGHGGEVCGLDAFTKERAVSCGRDGTMRLYKILDGSQLVFRRALTNSLDTVGIVNEQRFVSGGDDGAVSLWHITKKRPVSVANNAHGSGTGCDAWISAVAAGRSTDLAASGAGDGFVRLWQCEDKPPAIKQIAKIDVGHGFVNGLAIGQNCTVLVAAVGKEPRLGRWQRMSKVKSGLRFVPIPSP